MACLSFFNKTSHVGINQKKIFIMKRKLHLLSAVGFMAFMGVQTINAQTGGAFGGTARTINNLTTIQFEDFDLGDNKDATVGGAGPAFGYSDKSTGNATVGTATVASSSYRTSTSPDADIAELVADNTFKYVGSVQGGEFFYYSVIVGTTGQYHIDVNYAHGSATNKRIKIERLDTDLTNSVVLVDGTTSLSDALPKTANSSTFETKSAGPSGSPTKFDLEAGKSYVIKFSLNDAGPNYNWFQFVRDGDSTTLGVNDFKADKGVNVYPNPSVDGIFNLNESTKWEAFSILGAKIAQGEGTVIDLSAAEKGIYIIKTTQGTTKVIIK